LADPVHVDRIRPLKKQVLIRIRPKGNNNKIFRLKK
jgi:hypothetical protein